MVKLGGYVIWKWLTKETLHNSGFEALMKHAIFISEVWSLEFRYRLALLLQFMPDVWRNDGISYVEALQPHHIHVTGYQTDA